MENELWNNWSSYHEDPDQQKRIVSARKSSCTPITVDFTQNTATFLGSSGHHTTTLQKCSCIDFNRRKLPCKHMYRLAMELGCMKSDFSSNIKDVSIPKSEKFKLEEIICSIESLSTAAQIELLKVVRYMSNKQPLVSVDCNTSITELISNHFLEAESDNRILLLHYKRNEINKRVQTLGIPFKKNMRIEDLVSWCIENIPEHIGTLFDDALVVRLNPKMNRQKIHQYLHRKHDVETVFSTNGEIVQIPVLKTDLPDDDVTAYLKKYGYY